MSVKYLILCSRDIFEQNVSCKLKQINHTVWTVNLLFIEDNVTVVATSVLQMAKSHTINE